MTRRLPTLIECRTKTALLESIVARLVPNDVERWRNELPALFTRHQGNIRKCLRDSVVALKCTPVMCGSALGNKGVQLLLDGVCSYLLEPRDVENVALDLDKEETPVVLPSDPSKPLDKGWPMAQGTAN